MKTTALVLGLSILSGGAAVAEPEYEGRSLADWIAQTQSDQTLSDRQEAVRALGQIGVMRYRVGPGYRPAANVSIAEEIVPRLSELLTDGEAGVREAAARSLCSINREASEKAIPVLIGRLGDENERVRETTASALNWRGSGVVPAIPALVRTIRSDASPSVRVSAARALRTGGPEGVGSLIGLLDDENSQARLAALKVLENTYPTIKPIETPPAAVPKIIAQLGGSNPEICKSAAQVLVMIKKLPPAEVPRIVALLKNSNPECCKGAAKVLVTIKDLPPEHFATMLHHKDVGVRRIGASALLGSNREETRQLLPEVLELVNSDEEFRREHASGLWRLGPASIPILLKLIDDADPRVRGNAARGLGALGPAAKEAADPLKRLLADMAEIHGGDIGDRVCYYAARALNRILGDKDYRQGLPIQPPDGK